MPVLRGQGITDALLVTASVSAIFLFPVYNVSGNTERLFIYGKRCIISPCAKCRSDGLGHLHRTGIARIRSMIVKQDRLVISCHSCRCCNGGAIADSYLCISLTGSHNNRRIGTSVCKQRSADIFTHIHPLSALIQKTDYIVFLGFCMFWPACISSACFKIAGNSFPLFSLLLIIPPHAVGLK